MGGDSLNGTYFESLFRRLSSETIQQFTHAYRLRFGNLAPGAHAALAYDALRFLAEAIQKAGTTQGPQLRDALAGTKNFAGVTGIISMDPERNAVKSAVILKLEDGRYIYQETIQPEVPPEPSPATPSPSNSPRRQRRK